MTDLKTTFAGLSLRNPIIISSSGLTNSAGKNKKLAEDGAGAIVLKSLFEEQIMLEADQLKDPAFYPEASDYLEEYIREHKLSEYLTLIKESKKVCPIPIIASINCYTDSEWIDFAKMIEEAGADALEINILALQSEVQYTYGSFEQRHIDILRHISCYSAMDLNDRSGISSLRNIRGQGIPLNIYKHISDYYNSHRNSPLSMSFISDLYPVGSFGI
jgi:dihydroorotate dehydrogenase (fumarate)